MRLMHFCFCSRLGWTQRSSVVPMLAWPNMTLTVLQSQWPALTLRRKKLYTSDNGGNFASKREQRGTSFPLPSGSKLARGNVTDKNHHGSFPYQFLSRQAESQIKNENSGRSRPLYLESKPPPPGGWYATQKSPGKAEAKRTSLNYMLNDWLVTFTHLGIAAASASITTVGWTHILFNTQQGIIITATLLEWIFDGAKRPACHQRNATSVANYIIFTIHIHVLFPFPMRLSSTEKVV